jgi:hypothetical protein
MTLDSAMPQFFSGEPGVRRRARLIDSCALAVVLAAAAWMAFTMRFTVIDDAFITYRYSYNLATGNGFVYNPGEWYLGTTAPLYGLLLAVLGLPDAGAIPTISVVVSAISLVMCGAALYVYGRLSASPLAGFVAAMLFVTSPALVGVTGLETEFQVAVVLWAFVAYRLGRTSVAAALLAIAIVTRLDSAVALVVVGAHFAATRRRMPWREAAILGGVVLPFSLLALWLYGSPIPGTLEAKRAQAAAGGWWDPFGLGLILWLPGHVAVSGYGSVVFALAAVGAGVTSRSRRYRWWALPSGWAALHTFGYVVLEPAFYAWYAVVVVLGVAILAGVGADAAAVWMRGHASAGRWRLSSGLSGVGATAICLLALAPVLLTQVRYAERHGFSGATPVALVSEQPAPPAFVRHGEIFTLNSAREEGARFELYRAAGIWLRDHTPPDASIGYYEIGYMGYYARRNFIDEMGLVQPDVAPHVARGDFQWVFRRYEPDYIVLSPYSLCACESEAWFTDRYVLLAQLGVPGTYPLRIYERR